MAVNLLWMGQLLLSTSWLYLLSIYTPYSFKWLILFLGGVVCNIVALQKVSIVDLDKKYLVALIPFVVGLVILPFPYNLGSGLLLLGGGSIFLKKCWRQCSCIGFGFMLSGTILTLQTLVVPLFLKLFSRYHRINQIGDFISLFVRVLGLQATFSQEQLFIPTYGKILSLSPTWEQFGIYPLLNLVIAGVFLQICFWHGWGRLVRFLFVCIGYALLRYVCLVFLFLQIKRAVIFWQPEIVILSFMPLALVLMKLCPIKNEGEVLVSTSSWYLSRESLLLMGCIFLCGFAAVWAWSFQDPGHAKEGRILIDEKHSNWEWTTQKFNTEWYGHKSVYNYYCFADYLNYYYSVHRNIDKILTTELLKDYDILILKMPTERFQEEEIQAVEEFVKAGGGLFLIGDHTNVFGTSRYLNPIAERFGLRFKYDSTYDLRTGGLSLYKPPRVLPHPIVQNMPPFLFATSCSLQANLRAEGVIVGSGIKANLLDYSKLYFFPDANADENYEFGILLQAAALKHGRGRVVAFTDSTCFSNYLMFLPSKPEFALGVMEWLNRKNRYTEMSILFALIALLLAVGAIVFQRRLPKGEVWIINLCAALLGICFAIPAVEGLNRLTYALPKPHTKYTQICFETEYSSIDLPAQHKIQDYSKSYNTFYVWTQRLGYFPSLQPSLKQALEKGDLVVIANPKKSFTQSCIERITKYIKNGGALLLLDGPHNTNSTSNQLLSHFKMQLDFNEVKRSVIYNQSHEYVSLAVHSGSVKGGQPILTLADGRPVFSISRMGEGVLAVIADSYLFTDIQQGVYNVPPNPEQLKINRLEFLIFANLIGRKLFEK